MEAGFWESAELDGEPGFQFHDWNDMQPSREQVMAERTATAARQQKWRDNAKAKREANRQESTRNAVDNTVSTVTDNAFVTVYPTRPDPPLKGGGEEGDSSAEDTSNVIDIDSKAIGRAAMREPTQQLPIIEDPKAHMRKTIATSTRKTPGGKP